MNQDRTKRKLTAIFSADVVGYSRLMEEDEAWTIKSLEENKRLISELIKEYEGRVIDAPGDNLLAEFSSVINAVECAVKIQKELDKKNSKLLEKHRMEFRIGVNLGDVVEEDGRIYGRGVNIAARLEALTEPGGICISRRTYDHVKTQLDLGYEYLGEHNVKNISEPIRVYRVLMEPESAGKVIGGKKAPRRISQKISIATIIILIIIAAGLLFWNIYSHESRKIEPASIEPEQVPAVSDVKEAPKTIAVLPFVNRSSEKDQEYFVDGLSDEIITILSQISDLQVTSSTSSFTLKGSDKTIQEVAEILGVAYILEGSVRKAGNELRITAQLIQVADDRHLWSKTYERELKDIFDVQEDIAKTVADELKVTLGIDKSFKQLGGTDNVEAYQSYLIAKGLWMQEGHTAAGRALEVINAAIALDPEFALAWATKANVQNLMFTVGPEEYAAVLDASLQAAQKAIELEPNLAEAYAALGGNRMMRGEWIEAEVAFRKALELTTEPISGNPYFSQLLAVGHLEKAHEVLETQLRIDPLSPTTWNFYVVSSFLMGDTQRAEEEIKRAKELFGNQWDIGYVYNKTLVHLGAGEVISRNEITCSDDPICDAAKEYLDSPEKGLAELRRIYSDYDNMTDFNLINISMWSVYFGDPEFAMDAIEKASGIGEWMWYPVMKEVRQLPRFKELVREIGLVDYWNEFGLPDTCRPLENGDFECD